jgi:hypothetical protein
MQSTRLAVSLSEVRAAWWQMNRVIWPMVKAALEAGERLVLELRPEKRSDQENRLLHLLITAVSQQLEWAGAPRDVETWKRLLVAAWSRAAGEDPVVLLPALDGHGVDIVYRKTSKLSRRECADLIEYVYAWGAQAGVRFPEREEIPA